MKVNCPVTQHPVGSEKADSVKQTVGRGGSLRASPCLTAQESDARGAALLCPVGGSSEHRPEPGPSWLRLLGFHRTAGKPVCPPKSTPTRPYAGSVTVSPMLPGSQRKMLSPMWPRPSAMGTGIFLLLRRVLAVEFPNALTATLRPPLDQTAPCTGP